MMVMMVVVVMVIWQPSRTSRWWGMRVLRSERHDSNRRERHLRCGSLEIRVGMMMVDDSNMIPMLLNGLLLLCLVLSVAARSRCSVGARLRG